jgi:putative glycosyltransferase (TIGR04372 family)
VRGDGPRAVVAFLGIQALGDFVWYALAAASIARAWPGSRLLAIYRDDRPYKKFLIDATPFVTHRFAIPEGAAVPLDWFDGRADGGERPFGADWYASGFHAPDLFLTPSMIHLGAALWPLPRLHVPDADAEALGRKLVARGLDPDRWFVTLHMRELGYRFRQGIDEMRCVDPRTYLAMIVRLIRHHGGQVVRIGDPSAKPLIAMDGLIDLAPFPDGFAEQAFAVSRSRFLVGSDSGPTQLACGFGVPVASTNALAASVWNDGDLVLIKRFVADGGRRVTAREMLDHGFLTIHRIHPGAFFECIGNTPEELCTAADRMIETTGDCTGWRRPVPEATVEAQAGIALPLPLADFAETARLTLMEPD